ncbi:hypothetical protein BGZ46_009901 [Entomortierella lignicola]|nr:hypothetical protein BGZ46_009901 [Entomortierella lignicola]
MHEEGTSPIDDQANSSTSPTDGKARLAWRRAEFLVSRLGKLTEHWLEMSDKKHRYGSNLKPYHQYWLNHNTSQSFFYWLDKGDGKDVNLDERSRDRLDKERVKYLQEHERAQYVVHVIDGLLYYKQSGEIVHTLSSNVQAGDDVDISQLLPDNDANDDEATRLEKKRIRNMAKFIYVTDKDGTLYIARKVKGQFHHSSFLGGGTVCAAGGIIVNNGRIVKITPKSGHYRPTQHHFEALVGRLEGMGISLAGVSISKKILESNTASAEKILVAQELPEVATS